MNESKDSKDKKRGTTKGIQAKTQNESHTKITSHLGPSASYINPDFDNTVPKP